MDYHGGYYGSSPILVSAKTSSSSASFAVAPTATTVLPPSLSKTNSSSTIATQQPPSHAELFRLSPAPHSLSASFQLPSLSLLNQTQPPLEQKSSTKFDIAGEEESHQLDCNNNNSLFAYLQFAKLQAQLDDIKLILQSQKNENPPVESLKMKMTSTASQTDPQQFETIGVDVSCQTESTPENIKSVKRANSIENSRKKQKRRLIDLSIEDIVETQEIYLPNRTNAKQNSDSDEDLFEPGIVW